MANALGRLFDVSIGCVPTDVVAGAITGKRMSMKNYAGCTFIVVCGSGSTDIADWDLQQHTASSGGTTSDLDVTTFYYLKDATTLAGTEQWTKVTQSAASEVTDFGSASKQQIAVVEIDAAQLSDGYHYVSLDFPDAGSNGSKYVTSIYVPWGLRYQREPTLLLAPLG